MERRDWSAIERKKERNKRKRNESQEIKEQGGRARTKEGKVATCTAHTHARLGFPYHRNWPVTRARWPRRRRANDIYHRSVVARYTHFRIYRAKKGRKGHGRYLRASASRDFAVRGSHKFLFRFFLLRLHLSPHFFVSSTIFPPFFFAPLSGNPSCTPPTPPTWLRQSR